MGSSNKDYFLEHLTDNLTEDGIITIRNYLESGSDDVNTLSQYLMEKSSWFANECAEFSHNLALHMVSEYIRISNMSY